MTTEASSRAGSDQPTAEEGFADRVELALPARPELIFLARMIAAAVASRADFGYDQVEDLRLALDELCLPLLGEGTAEDRMQMQFDWTEDAIEVAVVLGAQARLTGGVGRAVTTPKPNELSERILDALVDSHGFDHRDGTTRSWLRMRRRKDLD
jgi:Histidine kinase-like ATPase domain